MPGSTFGGSLSEGEIYEPAAVQPPRGMVRAVVEDLTVEIAMEHLFILKDNTWQLFWDQEQQVFEGFEVSMPTFLIYRTFMGRQNVDAMVAEMRTLLHPATVDDEIDQLVKLQNFCDTVDNPVLSSVITREVFKRVITTDPVGNVFVRIPPCHILQMIAELGSAVWSQGLRLFILLWILADRGQSHRITAYILHRLFIDVYTEEHGEMENCPNEWIWIASEGEIKESMAYKPLGHFRFEKLHLFFPEKILTLDPGIEEIKKEMLDVSNFVLPDSMIQECLPEGLRIHEGRLYWGSQWETFVRASGRAE
ncbi:hypothetical protein NOR_04373 [Metarhizium rileyi]|uniref:Uncharacterized protein n=1 Tax=Metarhizium rileyi (strain RCEF 4871) TaxID=1649241 RepID=A0A162JG10_METRR|nr:hypothetical protein NOR_04373 [Metarhizium rileyi RCEF 4871]